MDRLGDTLLNACASATREIILIAPFIKLEALRQVISRAAPTVSVTVVVRFLPCDIAAGVTDPQIVEEMLNRPQSTIKMLPRLHAKIYRFDEALFIGSANLTGAALGWSRSPNLEVLVEGDASHPQLLAVEREALFTSVPLTLDVARSIIEVANQLGSDDPNAVSHDSAPRWIPSCYRPEHLFEIYDTGTSAHALREVIAAGLSDLKFLAIPKGLNRLAFDAVLKSSFLSSSFFAELLPKLQGDGITDDVATNWLSSQYSSSLNQDSPERAWSIIKQWLKLLNADGIAITPERERVRVGQVIGK
jgi:hypothetical protein